MVAHINETIFEQIVGSAIPTLVYIWSPTCAPCRGMGPIIEELESEMDQLSFTKINAVENMDLIHNFGLTQVPTFLIFKSGKRLAQRIGAGTKAELKEFILKAI